ncbi:hypothetical protein P171DRAFT_504572 [Karstenula rhodostoma CBS 690.94]|uniref:Protein kinase domain-containing protein n=1 Tax=Karstenula rhodostoma CBS 690.94 TaxID=1392251 RepID=A0A9P4P6T3_9PLEO|nr:hypothetical protein P171DRAFT_504572 [Karstenula rhodostoma CBS 690.94]
MSDNPPDNAAGEPNFFPRTAHELFKPLVKAGTGVSGTVYVCMQRGSKSTNPPSKDDIIAVKVWKPSMGASARPKKTEAASVLRKIKEGVAEIPCQHMVHLLELGYLGTESDPWYSMHVVKGCTFQRYLEAYDKETDRDLGVYPSIYDNKDTPLAMYFHTLRGCISAIKWLHRYDLGYRDFTQQNVMLEVHKRTELPRVILIDLDEVEILPDTIRARGFKMFGMLFSFLMDIQTKFPTDLPETWETLGSAKFEELEKLRWMGNSYASTTSSNGVLTWTSEDILNWVDNVEILLEGLGRCHDSKTVGEIADVVESIWSRTEDKVMEMAGRDGLVVRYM